MRNLLSTLALCLLVSAPALAEGMEKEKDKPISTSAAEVLKAKPTRDFPHALRSWDLENSPELNVRLHEITGTVPLHFHADAQERIFLVEGKLKMTLGDQTLTMNPGDYVSIPKGVKHKVELAPGTKRALAAGFTIPAPDPKQTTWLEPAPKPAPAK